MAASFWKCRCFQQVIFKGFLAPILWQQERSLFTDTDGIPVWIGISVLIISGIFIAYSLLDIFFMIFGEMSSQRKDPYLQIEQSLILQYLKE